VQLAFFVGEISLLLPLIDSLYWISARFMYIFCPVSTFFPWYRNSFRCLGHTRFYNFHGEPQARLERDQSVYGYPSDQKTRLIKIFSYLLFSLPDVHLRNLQKMQVDKILYKYDWDRTMQTMKDEWAKLTLVVSITLYWGFKRVTINALP